MSGKTTKTKAKSPSSPAEEGKKKGKPVSSSEVSPKGTKAAHSKAPAVTPASSSAKSSDKSPAPRKTSVRKSATLSQEDRNRRVAEVAYFIAERRGFVGGSCEADWYEAEAYLSSL